MTEEKLTKKILAWLEETGWEILAFDFPQSGTGVMLHPNIADRVHKNSDTIIPDIVALKTGQIVVFENKNRLVAGDFEKMKNAKASNVYDASLTKFLKDKSFDRVYWGIGMPFSVKNLQKAKTLTDKVDFVVFVTDEGMITTMGEHRAVLD